MARTISICGWETFQHYKDRDPPWIKLYRDVLTTESWVLGTDQSRLVQVASTLLAARYKNAIPLHHALFRKVASLDMSDAELEAALQLLHSHKFLEIKGEKEPASTMLAKCSSETEQSRAEQRESRAEESTASPTPRAPKAKRVSRETETPEWFLDFKLAYPNRAGDQGWRKALSRARSLLASGHTPAELIEGAKRYADFIRAKGDWGSEFVKQAASFLGDDKHFLEAWTPPPNKSQRVQDGNVEASVVWLERSASAA